jgi:hypothetical protein
MSIGVPRGVIFAMAIVFSAYIVVLGVYQLPAVISVGPVIVALTLYIVAVALSLIPQSRLRLPLWIAAFDLAVAVAQPLLVASAVEGPPRESGGYPTWYVFACGTLLTIVAARRRADIAWVGIAFLVGHTIVWAGPEALLAVGVGVGFTWVAVSHVLTRAMAKAEKDARRFALAEREATEWQAAQEAHVFERQFRLGQTSSMALAMLRRIAQSGGELTDAEREECLHLEAAIRDEIRGRGLLNDAVREQIMVARRRGTTVSLLDEGGLDGLTEPQLESALSQLAEAIRDADADTLIARTVPGDGNVAVTVVGLRSVESGAQDEDDEVTLWLEIPRETAATR